MALTSRARDFSLQVMPQTGKFRRVLSTSGTNIGNWQFDNTELHPVVMVLGCKRGLCWGDQTGKFGSLLYQAQNDSQLLPGRWVAYAEDALQPLVDQGRIGSVAVFVERITTGRLALRVDYHNQRDQPQPPVRVPL